jgi:prepilin-type N-terminal cleavage/methylation domain-containing protein
MTRRTRSGFTLVELMVVVAIVGLLSVLAVVSYRKLQTSAKMSEATEMLSNIRLQEEAYRAETGNYISTEACPPAIPTNKYTIIPTECPLLTKLGVRAAGAVWFQYQVWAGTTGDPGAVSGFSKFNGHTMNFPATTTGPWWVAHAQADIEGGAGKVVQEALAHSFNNVVETNN